MALSIDDRNLRNLKASIQPRLFESFGAHFVEIDGVGGVRFRVWAPNARAVSVIGDFNHWNPSAHAMQRTDEPTVWQTFVAGAIENQCYKFQIETDAGMKVDKADPFAFGTEMPPNTASVLYDPKYVWGDQQWMTHRARCNALDAPISIYEMHLGSWMLAPHGQETIVSYRGLAERLVQHVQSMGFTHVEFLPIMEHPYYGSWGYQTSSYFAPTRRYGSPSDLKYLIDVLHQHDIGVLLDWVPSHFITDAHGIGRFDGGPVYEHPDPQQGYHPDWKTNIFNYGRTEVCNFLLSSAFYWLEQFHADGLRVDAVASMLYRDYSRKEGEWSPNSEGGRENLEAIAFIRSLNQQVKAHFPDVLLAAEESTSWPKVSRPVQQDGLGFDCKWDMGWTYDSLSYMRNNTGHRKNHQNQLTFRAVYANNENYILPISHDDFVHGKGSLFEKMPGDPWQKFANLRLMLGYQYSLPGKKLLFMGCEFGQRSEWSHDHMLEWEQLELPEHDGIRHWVQDLNRLYRTTPALFERDCREKGFRWIDCNDTERSVLSYLRVGETVGSEVLIVCNFTENPHHNYRVGVPHGGFWKELINSDADIYGGSCVGNNGGVEAVPIAYHDCGWSVTLTLPPLAILFLGKG